ncbi:MAG: hypothetical protein VX335_04835 [Pseudomonadota bacterium]|nr:hypothetical protein [Pseudomonadota bacterium]
MSSLKISWALLLMLSLQTYATEVMSDKTLMLSADKCKNWRQHSINDIEVANSCLVDFLNKNAYFTKKNKFDTSQKFSLPVITSLSANRALA